jgi:transcriptional regulator with XRE-family HTH domain
MKHPFDVHVGGRLRYCRCLAGVTQQQLGDKLGIKVQQIQNYETGANGISSSHMRDIAAAMELPVSFFFEGLARALRDAA